jgi:hypothetical protein
MRRPEQRQRLGHALAGLAGEVLAEGQQVVHGRAAEGVDRLAGVADRHDRRAGPAEELHQAALGDVGVLVLVQQHVGVADAQRLGEVSVLGDQLEGLGDLVAEVDAAAAALLLGVALDQAGELDALAGGVDLPVRHALAGLRPLQQQPRVLGDLGGLDQMVGAGGGQLEGLADGGAGGADVQVLEALAVQKTEQDLVLLRLAEQVGVGLHPHPDPVLLDQVGREGVVGVDGDLAVGVGAVAGERLPHPGVQLGGGLVGEGERQHR